MPRQHGETRDSNQCLSSSLTLQQRIQLKVANRLRNMISLSDPVNLETPNGRVYPVEAKGEFGHIILCYGWKEFVSENHIEEDDSILFVCRGNFRFKVHIFDSSGNEKSSCSQPLYGAFGVVPPACSQIVGPPPSQIIDISSSDDDDDTAREGVAESCRAQKRTRSCAKTHKMASAFSPCTRSGYGASVKLQVSLEPLPSNLRQPSYIVARQTTLSMQVKRKVEEKVKKIGSELPIFVKALTTTNIHGGGKSIAEMVFGKVYASACLPDEPQPILLQLKGRKKQWPALLSVTCRNTRRVCCDGWKEFVGDNHLKVGDICLFEVSSRNSTRLTMTVHLVR
uniref:Uncharacterized protein n=1 Tax=Avena sativa TaxID=4498 RepID=A0ACD5XPS1_AVESA